MGLTLWLCLAMHSDRIIAKQGNSLVGLPFNWCVMTEIVYVFRFHQSHYFILRHFLVKELVDL